MPQATDIDELETYDEIPAEIMEMVEEHCKKKQTPVSMRALVKTGRQELADKSYRNDAISGTLNYQSASSRVLIQVRTDL